MRPSRPSRFVPLVARAAHAARAARAALGLAALALAVSVAPLDRRALVDDALAPAPAPAGLDEQERLLQGVRGLRFRAPVERRRLDRAGLRAFVARELDDDIASGRLRRLGRVYEKLGLAEPGVDLERAAIDLYSGQYVGFYDPRSKALTIVEEARGGADPDQVELILAHELTHALQDQHYDLERLRAAAEGCDDRALALAALVEGDAVIAAELYRLLVRHRVRADPALLGDLEAARGRAPRVHDALERARRGGADGGADGGPALADGLHFGYTDGARFCQRVAARGGGYRALAAAFADPPRSTEQVLHPERYLDAPRDDPIPVALPPLADALGEGWRSLHANTMGELYTRLVLARALPEADAVEAAAGWGGDRYEALESPDGRVVLAWGWVGDSAEDARQLAEAYARLADRRSGERGAGGLTIERTDAEVWIVDGATAAEYGAIRAAIRRASAGGAPRPPR